MSAVAARRSAKRPRFTPVLETLEGRITPSLVQVAPNPTAGPFHIAYHADYDAGAGPKTFFDGALDAYKGINQSGNAGPLNLRIGDTVSLRLRAQGDGTGTAPGLTVSCSIFTRKPP